MADRSAEVGHTKVTNRVDIPTRASNCASYLNDVVAVLIEDDATSLRERIEDERGRFRVWASNLGAFHTAQSVKSLEFRLRNSERMHQSVIDGLKRLSELSYRCEHNSELDRVLPSSLSNVCQCIAYNPVCHQIG